MTIETRVILDDYRNNRAKVEHIDRDIAEWEARLACALIERWGIVAAVEDGEDSAGRAKLRAMDPAELVAKACDTAGLAVAAFRERGWVTLSAGFAELDAAEKPAE